MAGLNDKASDFVGALAPLGRNTIFLVDFGGPDTQSPADSPPCGQESRHRGRHILTLLSAVEEEERRRGRLEVEATGAQRRIGQASSAVVSVPDGN